MRTHNYLGALPPTGAARRAESVAKEDVDGANSTSVSLTAARPAVTPQRGGLGAHPPSISGPAGMQPKQAFEGTLRSPSPNENTGVFEKPKTAAAELVDALVRMGVDTFFGVPGGPIVPLYYAVIEHKTARMIDSRHETAAAFAAASYHRVSGKVPALLLTAGPGATNAVTGVASAFVEQTPMVVLVGDVAWASTGRKLIQNSGPEGVHVESLYASITRKQLRAAHARSVVSQGYAALRAATDPAAPGPVLFVVPIDLGSAPAAGPEMVRPVREMLQPPPREVVQRIHAMLERAQRPLLVLGAGCRPFSAMVRRLVDQSTLPFVTTPQAKGIVSERHPRSLRHGGLAASAWARRYTAGGVDVALVLGTDLDDCAIGPTPYVSPDGELIHVDRDPAVFHRNLPTTLAVESDLGAFLTAFADLLAERPLMTARVREAIRSAREGSPVEEDALHDRPDAPISPARAVVELDAAAGDDAMFITDIGEHMLFALHYLTATDEQKFHIHLSLGSMGSGIAGAVGLALGAPKRRVVCICGDGGMEMQGMEMLNAHREKLNIVYAVFNDGRYNMVHHGMSQLFGRPASWESPFVDFAAWARAMGVPAIRIHRPGQISRERLDRLQAYGGPILLDIRIDREMRMKGAGRVEAIQHMSMTEQALRGERVQE